MSRKETGIRILGDEQKRTGKGTVTAAVFAFLCVAVLSCAWWNGFLSVFLPEVSTFWLYAGLAGAAAAVIILDWLIGGWSVFPSLLTAGIFLWYYRENAVELVLNGNITDLRLAGLMAAAVSVPVLEIWVLVFRTGKGRFFAGILMSAPFITAACFGYFQGVGAGWFLFLSGAVYFACSAAVTFRFRILAVLPFLLIVTGISIYAGRALDAGREAEGGVYQTTRNILQTELIENVERLLYREQEKQQTATADLSEDPGGSSNDMNHMEESVQMDPYGEESSEKPTFPENDLGESGNFSPGDDRGMDHLKSVTSFVPKDGSLGTVIVQSRPESTYYEVLRIGVRYTGDAWEEGSFSYLGNNQALSGEELALYLSYPEGLDRLRALSAEWDVSTFEAVKNQIDQVLELAVYDTVPGPTPQDQDFAEYFLFENRKGFCVHFATAAVLLYRICGYPSRYVEGYAIPPDAFVERDDGRYEAVIDGGMGHAWCQVYDEAEEVWTDVEHTPSASLLSFENPAGDPEAYKSTFSENQMEGERDEERLAAENPARILLALCLSSSFAAVILFLVQSRIRRKRLEKRIRQIKGGRGVTAMYHSILRTVDLMRMDTVPGEYGDWFQATVMKILFDRPETEKTGEEERWKTGNVLYREFARWARGHMTGWQRFQYRYIRCLEPL